LLIAFKELKTHKLIIETKKCEKCSENMRLRYKVCPRCGHYKYRQGELEETFKWAAAMKAWKINNPTILHAGVR